MATYLIDFENVGSDGLCGTEALTADDRIYIFYSSNSGRISMKMHQCICQSNADFKYFEISAGGKNALDFQLSTFLGYLISQDGENEIFIISKDRGFRHVLSFWKERSEQLGITGFSLIQKCSIDSEEIFESPSLSAESISESETDDETETENTNQNDNSSISESDQIRVLIQSLDDITNNTVLYKKLVYKLGHEKGSELYRTLGTGSAMSKQEFHRKMVSKFGQANGSVIYNKLKRLIRK